MPQQTIAGTFILMACHAAHAAHCFDTTRFGHDVRCGPHDDDDAQHVDVS